MTLIQLMGLFSTVAMAVFLIILLLTRLAWYKSFPAIAIYTVIVFSFNLIELEYIHASDTWTRFHGLVNNVLDVPLMLTFLTYFSYTAAFRKTILVGLGVFAGFEAIVLLIMGLNKNAVTVIIAPGVAMVLILSAIFFVHYVKLALVNPKAIGKLLMITSLLIAYAIYGFIYVAYYLLELDVKTDATTLFYLNTMFSFTVLSVGTFMEQRRVKHLAELNKTREELRAIYGEEETTTALPFEKAVFKFDKGGIF